MKLLARQLRCDFSSAFFEALKLCLIVPIMFLIIMHTGGKVWSPDNFLSMMALFALPVGMMALAITRVTISLHTSVTMGGTRFTFFLSTLLSSVVLFVLITPVSLCLAGLVRLPNAAQTMEIFSLALSPSLNGQALCINLFALGAGMMLGILTCRFGRKVFIIAMIAMVIGGGVLGGVIAAVTLGDAVFPSLLTSPVPLSLGAACIGLILYAASWPLIKKHYIS